MLHRLAFHAMGSQMLAVLEQESEQTPSVLNCVPDWFEEWEAVLSRFRPESELSRLNAISGQPVQVSQTLWDVFQVAIATETATAGLVTPTVLDAVVQAGYDRSFEVLPQAQFQPVSQMLVEVNPLAEVTWDEASHMIYLPEGVHLDLGGVAKGWAAHQAMLRLSAHGPSLVDAGGDIAISGPQITGEPWLVGVAEPFNPAEEFAVLHVGACGVATSGKDRRRWTQGDKLHHHLIDPRTGQSAETDVLTATVVATTVMEAEAAAKAIFILGSQEGLAWIEADPNLAGLLVMDDGRVICSQFMQQYL
jgi:thiamine biosynthesis lipoprotein